MFSKWAATNLELVNWGLKSFEVLPAVCSVAVSNTVAAFCCKVSWLAHESVNFLSHGITLVFSVSSLSHDQTRLFRQIFFRYLS